MVQRDGGRVIADGIVGPAALEHRLWLIARDRRLSIEPQPSRSCPQCGAARVANFRWCQSCGVDFEPWRAEPAPTPAPRPTPAPAPAASSARTATLERPATAMPRTTPAEQAPPSRAMAPGVAVFVLDPSTAATASMAAPARDASAPPPAEIRIASNRLPPAPRTVVPPPAQRGMRGRLSDALDASPFDGRLILIGAGIGLTIGILVTILLLAFESA